MTKKQFGPNLRSTVFITLLNLRLELLKKQVIGKVGILTVTDAEDDRDILYQATGMIKNVYVKKPNSAIVFVFDTGHTFTKFVKNTYTQKFPDGFVYSSLQLTEFNPDKEHVVNKSWNSAEFGDNSSLLKRTSKFEILCI